MKIQLNKTTEQLYNITIILLVFVATLSAASVFNIPGGIKVFVVESGSMEPEIKTKSIVVIQKSKYYQKGDIITFFDTNKNTVTHRIYAINTGKNNMYITKGDANDTPDNNQISINSIQGKVLFSIPYLGYPVGFAKTQVGLITLVIIPATIIIYSELVTIKNEAIRLIAERKKRKLSLIEKAEVTVGQEVMQVEKELVSEEKKILKKVKKAL